MLYIYSKNPPPQLITLAKELGATVLRRFDGMHFRRKKVRLTFKEEDVIFSWGELVPEMPGVRVLNPLFQRLGPCDLYPILDREGFGAVATSTDAGINAGNIRKYRDAGYIPRMYGHKAGQDMLTGGAARIDYIMQVMNFATETRVHVVNGKVMAVGLRIPKPGLKVVQPWAWVPGEVHATIRSKECGWTIQYGSNPDTITNGPFLIKAVDMKMGTIDVGTCDRGYFRVRKVSPTLDLTEPFLYEAFKVALKEWCEAKPVEPPVKKKKSTTIRTGGEATRTVAAAPAVAVEEYHRFVTSLTPPPARAADAIRDRLRGTALARNTTAPTPLRDRDIFTTGAAGLNEWAPPAPPPALDREYFTEDDDLLDDLDRDEENY